MTDKGRFTEYMLEHLFPHPIAAPFRSMQTALTQADRAAGVLATLDAVIRYTGNVLLADYFAHRPTEGEASKMLESLRYPTVERWVDLSVELARWLSTRDPFMPELVELLVNGKKGGAGEVLQELALMAGEYTQGETSLAEPRAVEEVTNNLEPGLQDVLMALSFLQDYPLVQFRMGEGDSTGCKTGYMARWMGYKREPLTITVEFDSAVPTHSLVLVNVDATKALTLAPFVQSNRCTLKDSDAVCMMASLRDKGTLRLDTFAGSRFALVQLGEEGNLKSLLEYMAEQPGMLHVLTPSVATAQRLRFRSRLLPAEKVLEGRFESVGFIGRGGIGAVYRVHDLEAQDEKAIKILYPDLSRNEFFTRYFVDVGKQLMAIDHPNVVKVFDASYSKALQENHILMAYVPGGSLAEWMLRRDVFPPKQAAAILVGILRGLAHLHGQGIIHGSIHPGNVLFSGDGTPMVGDFGIIKMPSAKQNAFRPLERIQSLRYSAPELLLAGQISEQSDLYSAALLFYEMVTGQIPSKTDFVPPSRVIFPLPEDLDAVVEKALALRPEERFASASEFADSVELLIEDMGIEFDVSPTVQAQRFSGHLADVYCGHLESADKELKEHLDSEDYQGAARVLRTKIDAIWDVEEKVFWMLHLADLYEEKLGWGARSMALYREALSLSPDNPVAVASLARCFEAEQNWEGLVELLAQLAEEADSPERSVQYLEKLVRTYRERLNDGSKAAFYLEKLVEISGAQERWIEMLVSLKEEIGDHDGAARALETWLELASDNEQRVRLLRHLALVYQRDLEDPDNAISVYEKLLELAPADLEAFTQLRQLYRGVFSYNSLSELLKKVLATGALKGKELTDAYQELGEITSSYLYDTDEATRTWNELLKIDPTNATALSYLERLYLREGRSDEYIQILERKIGLVEDPNEKSTTLISLAKARLEFLGDVRGSRELLEQAMRIDPRKRGLQEALERLHKEHGDTESLVQLRLLQLEWEESPAVRMELYWKLVELFSTEPMSALQVLMKAFKDNPRDPAVRRELERRGLDAGALKDLFNFYLAELEALTGEDREYVGSRIAMLALQHLSDLDEAIGWVSLGLAVVPDHAGLLKGYATLLRRQGNWPGLAEVILAQLKVCDEVSRVELFMELAKLVAEHLGGHSISKEVLDGLFDILPAVKSRHSLEALNGACKATGDWSRLTELLEQEERMEEDPVKAVPLRLSLGQAWTERGEFGRAVPYLEKVLERAPDERGAQDAMEKCLLALEDWKNLARLYRNWVGMETDKVRKIHLLEGAIEIEIKAFENVDGALELYRSLQSLAPEREETYTGLVALLTRAERWPELSIALTAASKTSKGARRLQVLAELAEIYVTRLENPDGAIETLRQLLMEDPSNEPALERMESIAKEHRRFESLMRALDERVWPLRGVERVPYLVKMARLAAYDMGLNPVAKRHLDEAIGLLPTSPEVFELYKEILQRHEDFKELARLYERRFDAVAADADKVALGLELATLLANKLQTRVRALDVLERVLEIDPKQAKATLMAASLYARDSRFDKAAPLLSTLQTLKVFLEPEERAEAVFLAALTYENLLDRPHALEGFRQCIQAGYRVADASQHLADLLYLEGKYEEARAMVLEVLANEELGAESRNHFEALEADLNQRLGHLDRSQSYLLGLLAKNPSDKEVLGKLVALAKESADKEGEVTHTQSLLSVEPNPEKRLPLVLRLAELLKDTAETAAEAAAFFVEAMEIAGRSRGLLLALTDIYIKLGRFDDAAALLREAEDREQEPAKKAQMALTQALLFQDYVGDKAKAAEQFKRVLHLDIARWEAFSALENMYLDSGDWAKQRELYEFALAKVDAEAMPDLVLALRKSLGRLLIEKFGDTVAAAEQFKAALELDPEDSEIREMMAGIYLQTDESLDKALEEYRALIQRQPRNAALVHLLRKALSKMKRYDEAWCVTGILQLLGDINPKEKAFYDKFMTPALRIRPKTVDAELMRSALLAPEEDWDLSQIIRTVFDRMADRLQLRTAKDLGYAKKDLFEEEVSPVIWKLMEIMGQVLGIQTPTVYLKESTAWWVTKEGSQPPVLVLGREALDGKRGKEARFEIGRAMSLFIPTHQVVGILDRQTLQTLVGNMLKLVHPDLPELPGDPKANAELRKEMSKVVPPVELGRVRESLTSLRSKGAEINLKRWLVGVEKSSARFGLLMANDIEVAASMVRAAPSPGSSCSRDDIIDDLIRFAVSAQYAELRAHLGISVL